MKNKITVKNSNITLYDVERNIYVADTSFLIRPHRFVEGTVFIPESVMEELKIPISQIRASLFDLEIKNPKKSYVKKVEEVAKKTGDLSKLSKADIEVLALALELNAKILTNDFRIQNVAKFLGLEFEGFKKIKKKIVWKKVCPKCGREFEDLEICPFCEERLIFKGKVEK